MRTLPEIIRTALGMTENVAITTSNDLTSNEELELNNLAYLLDKLNIETVKEIENLFVDDIEEIDEKEEE